MNEDKQKNAAVTLQQIVDEQQAKINEQENYMKALIEEFSSIDDFEEVRNKFRDELKKFAPQALTNIITMSCTAESESVRANLNKWVLEWVMSDKIDTSTSDIHKLLKDLTKAEPTTAPE